MSQPAVSANALSGVEFLLVHDFLSFAVLTAIFSLNRC